MAYHSVLTVSGHYITNTLEAYQDGKVIDFWINPYHKQEVANIKCGDFVGVFLMGIGLMYVGEVIDEPYIDSNQYVGVAKKATINDVFNAYSNRGTLQSIGLSKVDLINNYTKLINNSFGAKKIFTANDSILNLCLKPVGLSGQYEKGVGRPIGNSDHTVTHINTHKFVNPANGKTIISLYTR